MKSFEYYRPTTLKEAVNLLKTHGENTAILNGGSDLIVRMREGHSSPEFIVDIKHIPELQQIKVENDHVFIGACVILNDLGNHEFIRSRVPFLAQAALSVGSKQVRNRATCIGNICNASPLADTATPLLSLNAKVHIFSDEGLRVVPINEFFVFVRKTVLKHGEIVTGISFDLKHEAKGIFTKVSRRKEVDLSTVCATVVHSSEGYFISLGAVAPTPIRLYKTEALLNSTAFNVDAIEAACHMAADEVSPISDIRASEAYRREMVQNLVRNSLTEWL